MDGQLIQRWMNSCRLCLLDDGVKLPIFGEEGIVREVAHKIQSCFPIVLYNADPLSKIICQRCLFMLDTVYSFRQKCVETNSVFTSHLLSLKNNSSSVKQYLQALEKSGALPNSSTSVQQASKSSTPVRETRTDSQPLPQATSRPPSTTPRNQEPRPSGSLSASYRAISNSDPLANSSDFHPPVVRIKQEKTTKSVNPLIVSVVGSYSDRRPPSEASTASSSVSDTVVIKQEFRHLSVKPRGSPRQVCTPWYCKPCNKYYKSRGTLYKHKRYFCPSKHFNCGKFKCSEEFETETARIQHWISHLRVHVFLKPEELHSCDSCDKKFAYDHMLRNHMKVHMSTENGVNGDESRRMTSHLSIRRPFPYKRSRLNVGGRRAFCKYCDRSYSRQTKLNWHMKVCHKSEYIATGTRSQSSVPSVPSAPSAPSALSPIASNESGSKPFIEEFPPRVSTPNPKYRPAPLSKQTARQSSESHGLLRTLLQKSLKCVVCLKTFTSQQGLSNHMRSHGPKKIYRCLTCSRVFGSKKGLMYHQKTRHASGGVDAYRCRPCSQTFKSRSELLVHMSTHEKNKKEPVDPLMDNTKLLLCSYCNQVFSQSSELKAHLMTHKLVTAQSTDRIVPPASDKPGMIWPCQICSKEFTKKRNLVRHMKIHEKRMHSSYPCNTCGKKFLSKASALKHSVVHSLSKTFHCAVCNKIFFKIETLHNHSCTPNSVGLTMNDAESPTRDMPMENLPFDSLPYEDQQPIAHEIPTDKTKNCLSCGFALDKDHKCQYYQRDGTLMSYQVRNFNKIPTKRSSYKCKICGATFASCFSHNSHMKVHKKKHILKVPSLVQEATAKLVHHKSTLDEAPFAVGGGTFTPLDLRRLTSIDTGSSSLEQRPIVSEIPELIPPPFSINPGGTVPQYFPAPSYYSHDSTLFDENEFYQCSICTKTFHSEQGLALHIRSHEGTATKVPTAKITCPFCSRNYADAQAINQHILLNHPELSGIKE